MSPSVMIKRAQRALSPRLMTEHVDRMVQVAGEPSYISKDRETWRKNFAAVYRLDAEEAGRKMVWC